MSAEERVGLYVDIEVAIAKAQQALDQVKGSIKTLEQTATPALDRTANAGKALDKTFGTVTKSTARLGAAMGGQLGTSLTQVAGALGSGMGIAGAAGLAAVAIGFLTKAWFAHHEQVKRNKEIVESFNKEIEKTGKLSHDAAVTFDFFGPVGNEEAARKAQGLFETNQISANKRDQIVRAMFPGIKDEAELKKQIEELHKQITQPVIFDAGPWAEQRFVDTGKRELKPEYAERVPGGRRGTLLQSLGLDPEETKKAEDVQQKLLDDLAEQRKTAAEKAKTEAEQRAKAEADFNEQMAALSMTSSERIQADYEKRMAAADDQLAKNLINLETYNQRVAEITADYNEAMGSGLEEVQVTGKRIGDKERARMLDQYKTDFERIVEYWQNTTERMNDIGNSAFEDLGGTIAEFVTTGKADIGGFFLYYFQQLIRAKIMEGMTAIFGGGGGGGFGGFISGLFGGGKAGGGRIDGPTLVGERGPEIFDPGRTGGRIIPNGSIGSGGTTTAVQVSIENKGTPQRVASASATQTPKGLVATIVLEDLKSGGPIAQGIQGKYGVRPGGR